MAVSAPALEAVTDGELEEPEEAVGETADLGALDVPEFGFRTYAVFVDLPVHVELALPPMPVMPEGVRIDFEEMSVQHPDGGGRSWTVRGAHSVLRRKLIYSPRRGLSQYLELKALQEDR